MLGRRRGLTVDIRETGPDVGVLSEFPGLPEVPEVLDLSEVPELPEFPEVLDLDEPPDVLDLRDSPK